MQVRNRVREFRQRQALSVAALAAQVGVKRQTIYAIEAGSYVPNTLVSLRLAHALDVSVEELFCLERESVVLQGTEVVELLSSNKGFSLQPNQPLRLCRVGKRMIGVFSPPIPSELPAADAVCIDIKSSRKIIVRPFRPQIDTEKRLLAAGCDPGMSVLARHLARHGGVALITAGCSSLQALKWLKEDKTHVAGTHLRDEASGESNLPVVKKVFPRGGYRVITFAAWEEGLVVAKGNPKRLRNIADLSRRDLSLANREEGAGSRFLLDSHLRKHGLASRVVRGYDRIAYGHIPAAWLVHSGEADCCVATRAAALVFGLDFIPLANERYDLILPDKYLDLHAVQVMLDLMNRSALKRELEAMGGYDTSQTGRMLV